MAKLFRDSADNDVDAVVRRGNEIDSEELERLHSILAHEIEIDAVVHSDLKPDGSFGEASVVLHDDGITVIEDGELARQQPKFELDSVLCRDFVGNGVLEAKLAGDRRVELARYSRTYADAFQEFHRLANEALGVSQEQLEERNEKVEKVSGPKEESHTYRCPNCADVKHVMRRLVSYVKPYWPYAVLAQVLAPGFLIRFLVDTSLAPAAVPGVPAPVA
jgi:hypothetical protein